MWCRVVRSWFDRERENFSEVRKTVVCYGRPFRSWDWDIRLIRCLDGCAWITVDGDIADKVLAPGETATIPARRLALVTGMDHCVVEVSHVP
jgi:hypothetical protein